MTGPLTGLRVIDVTRGTAGPRATSLLADYDADVVWVEPPGGVQERAPLAGPYSVFNRGKRSVELDLSTEDGCDKLRELLATADVFVESGVPGEAEAAGFGFGAVHTLNPSLVYASISGFGTDGPYRDVPAREALVHALAGTMAEQVGHREGPIFEGLPFAGFGAAYLAAIGIVGALVRRERDGGGRHIETSLYDGALAYLAMGWGDVDTEPISSDPRGTHRLVAASFLCGDGEYIGVHTGAVGAFGRLMTALGFDDRIPPSEDGLDMGMPLDPAQMAILEVEIHEVFASKPRKEWLDRLIEADICAIPHLRAGQVLDEPQTLHNGMRITLDDPVLGRVDQVAPAASFRGSPTRVRRPAPTPGQHTEEVLSELPGRTPLPRPAAEPDRSTPLLEGLKILDLGAFYAGPYSSRLLADLGADVIKLEPVLGDPLRRLERVFRSGQAGKRSLAANFKDPDLADARQGLIEWADIIHHNMRPGAAERLGLGYEQVRERKPDMLYLHAPGWGDTGPDAARQSFAPMLSGYVGVGFEVAGQHNAPLFPTGNEDSGNGLLGALGMLMALYHRQKTGEGQLVLNPQLHAAMAHMAHVVRREDGVVIGATRLDPLQRGVSPLERLYETADGWLCISVEEPEIHALENTVGVVIRGDARFAAPADREEHAYDLERMLEDAFATRPTAGWLGALAEAGVPAAEPVPRNGEAFLRDPENQRTHRAAECPHPIQGRVRGIGVLLRASDCTVPAHRLAPELGEHTDELLRWLGYDAEKIAALRERGSVS